MAYSPAHGIGRAGELNLRLASVTAEFDASGVSDEESSSRAMALTVGVTALLVSSPINAVILAEPAEPAESAEARLSATQETAIEKRGDREVDVLLSSPQSSCGATSSEIGRSATLPSVVNEDAASPTLNGPSTESHGVSRDGREASSEDTSSLTSSGSVEVQLSASELAEPLSPFTPASSENGEARLLAWIAERRADRLSRLYVELEESANGLYVAEARVFLPDGLMSPSSSGNRSPYPAQITEGLGELLN